MSAGKNISPFAVAMQSCAAISAALTVFLLVLGHFIKLPFLPALTITAGTTCYHFVMRLAVGAVVPLCARSVSTDARWFQPLAFETKLYKLLGVKRWKDRMPTYDPEQFSMKSNTLAQIVHNMCVSELVHEVIAVLSFLPLLLSRPLDSFWPFLITSLLSAAVDTSFVIMQRYNRPRLVRLLSRNMR